MKLLLLKDVRKVGARNTIVDVADGYATNHLLPNKLATIATPDTVAKVAAANAAHEKEKEAEQTELAHKLEALKGTIIEIPVRATPKGGLFKSVSAPDIIAAIKKLGTTLPESIIHLPQPIKTVGEHPVDLSTPTGKHATVTVKIVAAA